MNWTTPAKQESKTKNPTMPTPQEKSHQNRKSDP